MPIIHRGSDSLHRVIITPAEAARVLGANFELCDMPMRPVRFTIAANMVLDWHGWGDYQGSELWELGDYAVQSLVDNAATRRLT